MPARRRMRPPARHCGSRPRRCAGACAGATASTKAPAIRPGASTPQRSVRRVARVGGAGGREGGGEDGHRPDRATAGAVGHRDGRDRALRAPSIGGTDQPAGRRDAAGTGARPEPCWSGVSSRAHRRQSTAASGLRHRERPAADRAIGGPPGKASAAASTRSVTRRRPRRSDRTCSRETTSSTAIEHCPQRTVLVALHLADMTRRLVRRNAVRGAARLVLNSGWARRPVVNSLRATHRIANAAHRLLLGRTFHCP